MAHGPLEGAEELVEIACAIALLHIGGGNGWIELGEQRSIEGSFEVDVKLRLGQLLNK